MFTQDEQTELLAARVLCDESLLFFTRFFFKELRGSKFIINDHHNEICDALDKVGTYKHELLNINIPPRFSKTEIVLNFIARSLGKNPTANFLYITASDELRSEVSVRIRDIITHPKFKFMYGVELKKDQNAKNLWKTQNGGGLKTATILGQITGFGAGQMTDISTYLNDLIRDFEGCICLDDINKVEDSESMNAISEKVNRVLFNTVFSRKNSDDTPIINIQQRVGQQDATAMLVKHYEETNNSHKVNNLVFPVIRNGKSLWENKMPMSKIIELRDSPFTKRTFQAQYMQNPVAEEGAKIKREWFEIIDAAAVTNTIPSNMYIDGAYTKSTTNDPTGIMTCFEHKGILYITGFVAKYLEMPELLKYIPEYAKLNNVTKNSRVRIEPKASGKSLKQLLITSTNLNASEITGKHVNEGKIPRVDACAPTMDSGRVKLIRGAWNETFLSEVCIFPSPTAHDEAVDCLCYAIYDSFMSGNRDINQIAYKKALRLL